MTETLEKLSEDKERAKAKRFEDGLNFMKLKYSENSSFKKEKFCENMRLQLEKEKTQQEKVKLEVMKKKIEFFDKMMALGLPQNVIIDNLKED